MLHVCLRTSTCGLPVGTGTGGRGKYEKFNVSFKLMILSLSSSPSRFDPTRSLDFYGTTVHAWHSLNRLLCDPPEAPVAPHVVNSTVVVPRPCPESIPLAPKEYGNW
jgi:hypothetical protein